MEVERLFQIVRRGTLEELVPHLENHLGELNTEGQSLLHEAVAFDANYVAVELISRGIDANIQDKNGDTALHFVAARGQHELASMLLDAGANPNIVNCHGNTALWSATFNAKGNYDLVELLLKHGAFSKQKNTAGRSPLDFAEQIEDARLVKLLKGTES